MKSTLKITKGKEGGLKLIDLQIEGDDPVFNAGENHPCTLNVVNEGAASFSYSAQLYLGTVVGDKAISLPAVSFSVPAGGTKAQSLGTLVVPKIFKEEVGGAPSVGYHTYVDLLFGGSLIATFTASAADVTINTVFAITITDITWA